MTILVVGASGATGRLLVQHLLDRGQNVKIIVRFPEKLPETLKHHDHLSVIQASISDLGDAEMVRYVKGCTAVASCLGHNLSLKGIYGRPRRLVTDATRRLCIAARLLASWRSRRRADSARSAWAFRRAAWDSASSIA